MKIFTQLILLVLFLQLSDTYKLILILVNKQTVIASIITLLILLIYILVHFKRFKSILKDSLFKSWLNIIFILPIFFTTLHFFLGNLTFDDYQYWIPFITFFGCLYVVSVMIFKNTESSNQINFLYGMALFAIIISFIITFINYDLMRGFMAVSRAKADIADKTSFSGRAGGFYMQSNVAAKAIVSIGVVIMGTFLYNKSKLINIFFAILLLVMILFTGSRTALAIIFITILIYLPPKIFSKSFARRDKQARLLKLIIYALIPIIAIISLLTIIGLSDLIAKFGFENLASRMDFLSNVGDANIEDDVSFQYRMQTILDYSQFIVRSLIIGYGPQERTNLINSGVFSVGSQNEYLEGAFAYGILYIFYYIHVLVKTFKRLDWQYSIYNSKAILLKLYIVVLTLYGFSLNSFSLDRVHVIVIGSLIGLYLASIRKDSEEVESRIQ